MSRLEKLQAMLAKEPNDLFLNFSVAMELAKTERHAECLDQFDRVIALDPNYVAAYFHRGQTLLALRRPQEAKEALLAGIAAAGRCGDHHAKSQMEQLVAAL